jgi:hypothetical protein
LAYLSSRPGESADLDGSRLENRENGVRSESVNEPWKFTHRVGFEDDSIEQNHAPNEGSDVKTYNVSVRFYDRTGAE